MNAWKGNSGEPTHKKGEEGVGSDEGMDPFGCSSIGVSGGGSRPILEWGGCREGRRGIQSLSLPVAHPRLWSIFGAAPPTPHAGGTQPGKFHFCTRILESWRPKKKKGSQALKDTFSSLLDTSKQEEYSLPQKPLLNLETDEIPETSFSLKSIVGIS